MNERIKLLAEQAGAVQYGVDYQRDAYPINLEELKKFAELIVQECCDLMQGFTFEEIATKVIKKNFGVEE